jgi:predicted deacylase
MSISNVLNTLPETIIYNGQLKSLMVCCKTMANSPVVYAVCYGCIGCCCETGLILKTESDNIDIAANKMKEFLEDMGIIHEE